MFFERKVKIYSNIREKSIKTKSRRMYLLASQK